MLNRVMATASRRQLGMFPFCAQWAGIVRMMCPDCGVILVRQFRYHSYQLRCPECSSRFTLGLWLRRRSAGNPNTDVLTPRDMAFVLPPGGLDPLPWRAGDPVHRVTDDDNTNDDVSRNVTDKTGVTALGRKRRKRLAASQPDPAAAGS